MIDVMALLQRAGRSLAALGRVRTVRTIYVSEPDIDAALRHLRALPFADRGPVQWHRLKLLQQIEESVRKVQGLGSCTQVAPGVHALVCPFAVDLRGGDDLMEDALQVQLLVRRSTTDPNRMTRLRLEASPAKR